MAVGLAEAGADIVGVSASLEKQGSLVGEEVEALGRSFTAYQCDFGDRSSLKSFIAEVTEAHPTIDILVNNAGTIRRAPAAEHPDEDWDAVIEVNLSAQFLLSKAIGAQMIERGKWQDHIHRICVELPGRYQRARLLRKQGRYRAIDHGAGQ